MKNLEKVSCVCPDRADLTLKDNKLICTNENCIHSDTRNGFRVINNVPVLISDMVTDTMFSSESVESYVARKKDSLLVRIIRKMSNGGASQTKKNCRDLIDLLNENSSRSEILVIGSGEIGNGTDAMFDNDSLDITGTDVYLSDSVDYVSDAHYLPFKSNSFDAVWIQAVLEHVLEPEKVVSEIHRVLKRDGYVYAETPFMQQVHEGAYDFTRFTVLGHRYLFKSFRLIKMGGNRGAGSALAWSVRYFFWALFRNRILAKILSLPFSIILRFLDGLISKESLYDSSSGVFFLGVKSNKIISKTELVTLYKGMQ
tara:strand:+ start:2509 stop:3447 length:939 start_codon:yes stop_codon:yes gene_type:complete